MLNNKTAHTLFYKRNPEKKKLSTSPVFQYEVCFYDCGNKKTVQTRAGQKTFMYCLFLYRKNSNKRNQP